MTNRLWILCCLLLTHYAGTAQDSSRILQSSLVSSFITDAGVKASRVNDKLDRFTQKSLDKFQQRENRIRRKLERKDSAKAAVIFNNADNQYKQLEQRLQKATSLKRYIPGLDSLNLSMQFLQQENQLLSGSAEIKQKLESTAGKIKQLESRFGKADEIAVFLRERKQLLREQLQNAGLAKQLKKLNRQAYYYLASVSEYQELLKDHKKAERKVIECLSKTKVFNDFVQKNNFLSKLFPSPTAATVNLPAQAGFAGLQTRLQVSNFIQQVAMMSPSALSQMQYNIQDAQSKLTDIRNKIAQTGGGDDLDIPDFKTNAQKTKSFFKRLEYGANLQSQKAKGFFPATGDLGLSVGYKLNDKSVFGIGASYKLGFGRWNNIRLTNQGLGLRSYIDWKIKGSFWLSGGYEQNYLAQFNRVDELNGLEAWQQSGLVGLSKVVTLKTKFFKKTKLQLLWDFLSYQQVPVTQPLLFRIGYNF